MTGNPVIPLCPHCNLSRGTYVNSLAKGTAKHWMNEEGDFIETSNSKYWFKPSKVIRCDHCKKIRRDLGFWKYDSPYFGVKPKNTVSL